MKLRSPWKIRRNNGRFDNVADSLLTCLDCKAVVEKRYRDEHLCFGIRFGDSETEDQSDG